MVEPASQTGEYHKKDINEVAINNIHGDSLAISYDASTRWTSFKESYLAEGFGITDGSQDEFVFT